jgi:hypothetical protein
MAAPGPTGEERQLVEHDRDRQRERVLLGEHGEERGHDAAGETHATNQRAPLRSACVHVQGQGEQVEERRERGQALDDVADRLRLDRVRDEDQRAEQRQHATRPRRRSRIDDGPGQRQEQEPVNEDTVHDVDDRVGDVIAADIQPVELVVERQRQVADRSPRVVVPPPAHVREVVEIVARDQVRDVVEHHRPVEAVRVDQQPHDGDHRDRQ